MSIDARLPGGRKLSRSGVMSHFEIQTLETESGCAKLGRASDDKGVSGRYSNDHRFALVDGDLAQMPHDLQASRVIATEAAAVPQRSKPSSYPEPFFSRMAARAKRPLGDLFGLKNFGVNLTTLEPGGESSILHRHTKQDEFVYIVEGRPTLVTDEGECELAPGMCAGFAAGGIAHQLVNKTNERVAFLEVGDRTPGDEGSYPSDDLVAKLVDGRWAYTHKDGRPYI